MLQMTLRDEMFDIRSAYHEPPALLKVDRLRYADGDIEFMKGL
jgi:hypothetical protein